MSNSTPRQRPRITKRHAAVAVCITLAGLAAAVGIIPSMAQKSRGATSADAAVQPQLDIQALAQPLAALTPAERKILDRSVDLIRQKQHGAALAELSQLIASNPDNSALRVVRAYVLLEVGNVTGALNDAEAGESHGIHSAYKCWFLAQVAYLSGNAAVCRREIHHVGADPRYGSAAQNLGQRLK